MTLEEWLAAQPDTDAAFDKVVNIAIIILGGRMADANIEHHVIVTKADDLHISMHITATDNPVRH